MAEVHKLTKTVEVGQEKSVLEFQDSMAEVHKLTKTVEVGQEKSVLEFQDSMVEVHKLNNKVEVSQSVVCTRVSRQYGGGTQTHQERVKE